jgi:DNA mismatch repair ATPase MutS
MFDFLTKDKEIAAQVEQIKSKWGLVPPGSPKQNDKNEQKTKNLPIYHTFQLPITYLESKHIHTLSDTVITDLELVKTIQTENKSMYDILFQPKHEFSKQLINEWSKQYTSHIPFLEESQQVLYHMKKYQEQMKNENYSVDCDQIMEVWKSTKENPTFLEKFGYMEWEMLLYLNQSSSFLQSLSIINLLSPLVSLILPIILMIFPFILLKMQGVPITFYKYLEVLKTLAKNHFIGKAILSMTNFSIDKIGYLLFSLALYFLQMYQNAQYCYRYYRNLYKINHHLVEMKKYVEYSVKSIRNFVEINENRSCYREFCEKARKNANVLEEIAKELSGICFFKSVLGKAGNLGYILRCYYSLYSRDDYEAAIRYSIGFEGYIHNLLGVFENLNSQNIALATFDTTTESDFTDQYYPPYVNDKHVKNSCHFDKNMIITGVNASGKTTVLKTTTLNIIFTQQLGCGFYRKLSLNPYTHIHSYLNIPDTSGRDSLFQAESRRCKEIIDVIGERKEGDENRHFCIFDELYSGTNPVEASLSAYTFLLYLSKFPNVDFMLTTHYTSICKRFRKHRRIRNYKMDVERTEDGTLVYKYKLKPGICQIHGAVEILKSMEYPVEIIQSIEKCCMAKKKSMKN